MNIDTGAVVGKRSYLVSENYRLKGMFDTREEAQAFIEERQLQEAKISRADLVGLKTI